MSILSKLIIGARPPVDSEHYLRQRGGFALDDELGMCVFEVHVDRQVRYCCWAGGVLLGPPDGIDGPPLPSLTAPGQAACLALANLPFVSGCALVFHGLIPGDKPLRDKVLWAFRQTVDMRSVICFVGDLSGALKGRMAPAFNLQGALELGECAGMPLPGERREH